MKMLLKIKSNQRKTNSKPQYSMYNLSGSLVHPCHLQLLTFDSTLRAGTSSDLIEVGVFTHVYNLGEGRVRKVPASDPDNLDLAIKSIRREVEGQIQSVWRINARLAL
jgi:hypothetical protein